VYRRAAAQTYITVERGVSRSQVYRRAAAYCFGSSKSQKRKLIRRLLLLTPVLEHPVLQHVLKATHRSAFPYAMNQH
jgi:hypothetical protein